MIDSPDPSILIVDESRVETAILLILLSTLSRRITACSCPASGSAILRHAASAGEMFDLLFLALSALRKPDMSTVEQLLHQARRSDGRPPRVILLADQGGDWNSWLAKPARCGVITRPINREKLAEALSTSGVPLPRLNCWEYMECGREQGGKHAAELGVCPAAVEMATDGIHGGKRGGRACWAISGTLCGNCVRGSFARKIKNCLGCDFYKVVTHEEGDGFENINFLLNTLKRKKSIGGGEGGAGRR